jgi:hypothetical protein
MVPRVLLVVLATLLPLLALPSSPADAAPPPTTVVARDQRASSDQFPRLPAACYDSLNVITSPCRVTRFPGRPMVILWGDSHAQMYLPAIRRVARNHRVNLVAVLFGGCPVSTPFPDTTRYPRTGCDQHNIDSLAHVRDLVARRKNVRIILNGFWSGYRHAYELIQQERRTGVPSGLSSYRKRMAVLGVERSGPMVRQIGRLGVPVDLISQAATVPLDPRRCAAGREPYQCDLPRHRALYKEADNRRWLRSTLAPLLPPGGRTIDATPAYCTRQTCYAHVRGVNTFFDDIHLGAGLTSTMVSYFRPTFRDLLAR